MLGSISTCFQFHVNFFPCAHLGHISHARDHSTCIIIASSILSLHHVFTFLLCYAPPFLLSVSSFIILPILFPIQSIITAHFVYKSFTASDEDVTFFSSSVCHEGRWLLFRVQVAVELKPHLFAVKFLFL